MAWLKHLKQKIIDFDIKPIKPIIPELVQQADVALENKQYLQAEKILLQALRLNGANFATLFRLVDLYFTHNCPYKAMRYAKQALRSYPQVAFFHEVVGACYARLGKLKASAKAYNVALQLRPDAQNVQHFYAAATGSTTPSAPREYIVGLFDEYASRFESSLVDNLQYTGHVKLAAFIDCKVKDTKQIKHVLDLGCGTGLLGQELLKYFKIQHLCGVDLSPKMLEFCNNKNIYHALQQADLVDYLQHANPEIDLIISTDVLIYLGDLNPVFEHCYRILSPGAYFAFSVEKLWWGDFKLRITGRYQHSLAYLKSLYKKYQFSKMYSQTIDLRKESGNMVAGYLVLLQK